MDKDNQGKPARKGASARKTIQGNNGMILDFGLKEKRESVLYVRITEENKDFVEAFAEHEEISTSNLMNIILTKFREANQKRINTSAGKKGKSN